MDYSALATIAAPIGAGLLGLIGVVLTVRARAKVDISTTITAGFNALTDQLQEEQLRMLDRLKAQRVEITELEHSLVKTRKYAELLEATLDRAGLQRPDRTWD